MPYSSLGIFFMRILLISLLIPVTFHSQSLYNISRIVHVSGAAFDVGTTLRANQSTKELNPILGQQPVRQALVVSGLTLAVDRLTHSIKDEHPRIAAVINLAAGSLHIAAGSWNIGVIREQRNTH